MKHMENISRHERLLLMRDVRQRFRGTYAVKSNRRQWQLTTLCDRNQKLRTYIELRDGLSAIWERSNKSHEQLLSQLQDWCRRAEHSGINALEAFSLRLRQYA
uniref:DesA/ISL3 alpha bundle tail domain-containing protein n=1 Tax=Paraburkholderia sediminicola TaxID=458836 RepID=UPI0038BABC6A